MRGFITRGGLGLASQAGGTTQPTVPSAPIIGTAVAGNTIATVNFSTPISNGGSPIISYTATSAPGGIQGSGSASPITVNGLTNGTGYTFTVTATNSVGVGPPSSSSNSVIPNSTGAPSAVANFQLVNQGGVTNNAGSVTTALMQQTILWTAATGAVDHYQIIRRTNYGTDVDYATVPASQLYYTDPSATNFFNAPNIAQGTGSPIGPTTVYDYDVVACADAAGTNRGPKPAQFTLWHYRGGVSGTATGGSTTTIVDTGQSWTTDQWVGYHVFDLTASTNSIVLTNNNNTLTMVPGFSFGSSTSGHNYQIGGDYFSGVGDVSFGQALGSPAFTNSGGSPVAPHTFCLGMTHDGTAGNMGLQRPSASPDGFIYGLEIGAFNYSTWNQRPATTGQGNEFAIHHRCPTGDLPGPPVSNISSSAMLSYGPSPLANTWQSYKVPLSVLQFTTPLGGRTTFTGSITGGVLTVTSFSGPGFDSGVFITGTGVDAGTYISNNSGGQNGNGTYTVLKNAGAATSNASTFTDGKAFGTNFYKGQYKVVGTTFANQTTYYDDICSTRV